MDIFLDIHALLGFILLLYRTRFLKAKVLFGFLYSWKIGNISAYFNLYFHIAQESVNNARVCIDHSIIGQDGRGRGNTGKRKKKRSKQTMEIMEIQRAALVVLILIAFIQLLKSAVLLEHQRHLAQRRFYDVMLSADRRNAISPILVLNVLNASEFLCPLC